MRCLLWVVVYPGEYQHLPLPSRWHDRCSKIRGSSNLSCRPQSGSGQVRREAGAGEEAGRGPTGSRPFSFVRSGTFTILSADALSTLSRVR
jgi:hypothetical protein